MRDGSSTKRENLPMVSVKFRQNLLFSLMLHLLLFQRLAGRLQHLSVNTNLLQITVTGSLPNLNLTARAQPAGSNHLSTRPSVCRGKEGGKGLKGAVCRDAAE